jgi:hypothetical protein
MCLTDSEVSYEFFEYFFAMFEEDFFVRISGDRRKKNSVYRPGGREVEIRSIKIFQRVGEQIRFGKKNLSL